MSFLHDNNYYAPVINTTPADYIADIEINNFKAGMNISQYSKIQMYAGSQEDIIDFFPYGTYFSHNLSDNDMTLCVTTSDLYPFVYIYERDNQNIFRLVNGNVYTRDAHFRPFISRNGKAIVVSPNSTAVFPAFQLFYKNETTNCWEISNVPDYLIKNIQGNTGSPAKASILSYADFSIDDEWLVLGTTTVGGALSLWVFKKNEGSNDYTFVNFYNSTFTISGIFFGPDSSKLYVFSAVSPFIKAFDFNLTTGEITLDNSFSPPVGMVAVSTSTVRANIDREYWHFKTATGVTHRFMKLVDNAFTLFDVPLESFLVSSTQYSSGWGKGDDKKVFVQHTRYAPIIASVDFSNNDIPSYPVHTYRVVSGATTGNPYFLPYDNMIKGWLILSQVAGSYWIYRDSPTTTTVKNWYREYSPITFVGGSRQDFTDDKQYAVESYVSPGSYGYNLYKRDLNGSYNLVNYIQLSNVTVTYYSVNISPDDYVFCAASTAALTAVLKINRSDDTLILLTPDTPLPIATQGIEFFGDNHEYCHIPVAATNVRVYKIDKINNTLSTIEASEYIPTAAHGFSSAIKYKGMWYLMTCSVSSGNGQRLRLFKMVNDELIYVPLAEIPGRNDTDYFWGTMFYGNNPNQLKILAFMQTYPFIYIGRWNDISSDFTWTPFEDQFSGHTSGITKPIWINRKISFIASTLYPYQMVTLLYDDDTGNLRFYRPSRVYSSGDISDLSGFIAHRNSNFIVQTGTFPKINNYYGFAFQSLNYPRIFDRTQLQAFGQALSSGKNGELIQVKSVFF